MSVWHMKFANGNAGAPSPSAAGVPLVDISRPDEAAFKKQLEFLETYADLRPDRASEILAEMGGGMAFLSAIAYLNSDRTKWTIELIATVLRLARHVEMRFKHALASRRALEYSPQVQPMIATPTHGSYPSGHATETFSAAVVLGQLLYEVGSANNINKQYKDQSWREQLMRL